MFPSPSPRGAKANPYETWSEACLKMEQRERLEADTPVKPSTFGPEMKLLYMDGNSMDENSMGLSPEAQSPPPTTEPAAAAEGAQASPSVADIAAKFMRELQANNNAPPRPSGQPGRVSPCIDAVRQQYLGCASTAEGATAATGLGKSLRPPLAPKDVNVPSPFAPARDCQTARPVQAEAAKSTMPAPLPRPRQPPPVSPAAFPSTLYHRAPVSALSMSTTDETATRHVQSPKRTPVCAASPATLESPFESGDRGTPFGGDDDYDEIKAEVLHQAPSYGMGYESPGATSRVNNSVNYGSQVKSGGSEELYHSSSGKVAAWPTSPEEGDARANLFGSPQPHMHMRRAVRNAQWLPSPELPSAADSSQNCSLDLLNSLASPTPRGGGDASPSPQAPTSETKASPFAAAAAATDGVDVEAYTSAVPEKASTTGTALIVEARAEALLNSSTEESQRVPSVGATADGSTLVAVEPTTEVTAAAAAPTEAPASHSPGESAGLNAPAVTVPPLTPAMQPSAACPAQLLESHKINVGGGDTVATGSSVAVLPTSAAGETAASNTLPQPASSSGGAAMFGSPALAAAGGGVHSVAALSTTPAMCATLATELSPQWGFEASSENSSSFSLLSSSKQPSPAQLPTPSPQQQQEQPSPAVYSSSSSLSPMPSLGTDKNMNFQQRFAALRALAQARGTPSPDTQSAATGEAASAAAVAKAAAEAKENDERARAAAAEEEARAAAEAAAAEAQAAAAEAQAAAEEETRATAAVAAEAEARAVAEAQENEERASIAAAAEAQAVAKAEAARLASESEAWAKEQARKRAARHRADDGSLSPAAVTAAAAAVTAAAQKKAAEAERKAKEQEDKEAQEAELRQVAAAAAAEAESARIQKERDETAAAAAQELREEQEKAAVAATDTEETIAGISTATSSPIATEEASAAAAAASPEADSVADVNEHALAVEHAHILAQAQHARQVVRDNAARRAAVEDKKRALRERQAAAAASAQRAVRAAAEEVRAREARAAAGATATTTAIVAASAAAADVAASKAAALAAAAEAEELEARRGAEEEVAEFDRRARAAAALRKAPAAATVGSGDGVPSTNAPKKIAAEVVSKSITNASVAIAVNAIKEPPQQGPFIRNAVDVSNENTVLVPAGLEPDVAAEYAALAKAAARFQELKTYLAQHELQVSGGNPQPGVGKEEDDEGVTSSAAVAGAVRMSGGLEANALEQNATEAIDPCAALESSTLTFDVATDERGNTGLRADCFSTTKQSAAMPTHLSPTPEPVAVESRHAITVAPASEQPVNDGDSNNLATTEKSTSLCFEDMGNDVHALALSACGSESLSMSGTSTSERARVANLVRDVIRSSPAAASRGSARGKENNQARSPHPQARSGNKRGNFSGAQREAGVLTGEAETGLVALAPTAPAVAHNDDDGDDDDDNVLMGDATAADELETSAYWNLAENGHNHGVEGAAGLLSPKATAAVFCTPGGVSSSNRRRPPLPPHTPPFTDMTKAALADDEWTFAAPSPQQQQGTCGDSSIGAPRNKHGHSSSARLFEECDAPSHPHPVAVSSQGGGAREHEESWYAAPPLPPTPSVLQPPRGKRWVPKHHHKSAAAARDAPVGATSVASTTSAAGAAGAGARVAAKAVEKDTQHGNKGSSPHRPAFRGKTLAVLENAAPGRAAAESSMRTSPNQRILTASPEKAPQPQPTHEEVSGRRRPLSPWPVAGGSGGGGAVDEQSETLVTSTAVAVKEVSNMAVTGSPTAREVAAAEAAAASAAAATTGATAEVRVPACYDDGALQLVCHAGDFAETRLELTNGSNGYLELAARVDPHEVVQQRQKQQQQQQPEREQQTPFFCVAFVGGESPPLLCDQPPDDAPAENNAGAGAGGLSGREKAANNSISRSNTSSSLRLAPGGKAALVVRFLPEPSANPAVLATTLHLSRRPVGAPLSSSSSSAVATTKEKAQTSALRLQGTIVGAPSVHLSCPDHGGLAWTAPMPTAAAAALTTAGVTATASPLQLLPARSCCRRVQVRNDGMDPCVVECEVLGGGATFAVHEMTVTDVVVPGNSHHHKAALPPSSSIAAAAATKVPRVSLAVGATATILVSCSGFDQAAASANHHHVASSSDTAVSIAGPLAKEVTAVLLVRASPDLDVILFGAKKPRAGSAHLADGTVPRAHALPLRLKATAAGSGAVGAGEEETEEAHLLEAGPSNANVNANAAEEAVVRHHRRQSPCSSNAPTLELTPRHLELVESAGALEGWLALRLKPDEDDEDGNANANGKDNSSAGPVAFTVCCPHPKIVVQPSQGLLRRRSCLGGHPPLRGHASGAEEGGDGTVWVQVCISLADVSGLRCTALEIEVGPGGQRRCVPVRLPAVMPATVALESDPAAAAAAAAGALGDSDFCDEVYFKGAMVNFGRVSVGELRDLTLRLCNANAASPASVHLDHPGLPFVLRHHMVTVRPRAYVKVPLRFAPCVRGDFEVVLAARRPNGGIICQVTLVGTAF